MFANAGPVPSPAHSQPFGFLFAGPYMGNEERLIMENLKSFIEGREKFEFWGEKIGKEDRQGTSRTEFNEDREIYRIANCYPINHNITRKNLAEKIKKEKKEDLKIHGSKKRTN